MNPTDPVVAANRFGLGARPGDLAHIGDRPRAWLLDQLAGPSKQPRILRDLPGSPSLFVELQQIRRDQREARRNDEDTVQKYGRFVREHYVSQTSARYRRPTCRSTSGSSISGAITLPYQLTNSPCPPSPA